MSSASRSPAELIRALKNLIRVHLFIYSILYRCIVAKVYEIWLHGPLYSTRMAPLKEPLKEPVWAHGPLGYDANIGQELV